MSNYFINNAGANEKVITFEAWLVWQKLNSVELSKRLAKKQFGEEINKAIEKRPNVFDRLDKKRKRVGNLSAVSFV